VPWPLSNGPVAPASAPTINAAPPKSKQISRLSPPHKRQRHIRRIHHPIARDIAHATARAAPAPVPQDLQQVIGIGIAIATCSKAKPVRNKNSVEAMA